uniref:Tyrosine-protein kinase n=1 Tax=Steinernema glaseri TaxID=37863 RepID=A0A1I7YPK9_9BILA
MGETPSSKANEGSQNIEDQQWYHGLRSRADIEPLLSQPGDWLVRATESRNKTEIVISVRSEKRGISNLTIRFDGSAWQLGVLMNRSRCKRFPSICGLISYYKQHKLPGRLRLLRAIHRPKWLVKHEAIKYDKTTDLLGSGNFCHVYKGVYERKGEADLEVAVKVCHSGGANGASAADRQGQKEAKDSMLHEAKIMSYYSHENVIQFYGVACDHHPIMIVMEFCPGGSLDTHLKNMKKDIDVGERVLYCLEAAQGMSYLHEKSCLHRDLAARNCLISAKGIVKIADFGLSKMVGELNEGDAGAQQVPVRWMAPETLQKTPSMTTKSDVWSFGVLVFEIFNLGEKPWPDDPAKKVATLIRRGRMVDPPELAPQQIRDLMLRTWKMEPELRPNFKEIVTYITDVSKNQIPPPIPEKCTTNLIPGVKRCPFGGEDIVLLESEDENQKMTDTENNSERTQKTTNTGEEKNGATSSKMRKSSQIHSKKRSVRR